jgi:hypothetical protein
MSEGTAMLDNVSNSGANEYMREVSFEAEFLQLAWVSRDMVIDALYSSVVALGYGLVLNTGA